MACSCRTRPDTGSAARRSWSACSRIPRPAGARPPAPGTAGADEDAVVVAPGGKAQALVDFQILDREQDVGAVLNDLTEQPLQGAAALVEHAGRVQDGAVDAAALEDADILQHRAVGGKQVVGIHLKGVDAAQLLNGRPAGHHGPHAPAARCSRSEAMPAMRVEDRGAPMQSIAVRAAAPPLMPPPNSRNTNPASTGHASRMYAVFCARRSPARSSRALLPPSLSSAVGGRLRSIQGSFCSRSRESIRIRSLSFTG